MLIHEAFRFWQVGFKSIALPLRVPPSSSASLRVYSGQTGQFTLVVERAKPGIPAEGLGTVPGGKGIFVAVLISLRDTLKPVKIPAGDGDSPSWVT